MRKNQQSVHAVIFIGVEKSQLVGTIELEKKKKRTQTCLFHNNNKQTKRSASYAFITNDLTFLYTLTRFYFIFTYLPTYLPWLPVAIRKESQSSCLFIYDLNEMKFKLISINIR